MDTNNKKTSWEEQMKLEFEKKDKTKDKGYIHRENKFKHNKKDYQKKLKSKDIK